MSDMVSGQGKRDDKEWTMHYITLFFFLRVTHEPNATAADFWAFTQNATVQFDSELIWEDMVI